MKTPAYLIFLGALSACTGTAETDTDTDANADSDTDLPPACDTSLATGTYQADGTCFGMAMSVDLTLGTDVCTFTLGNWNMIMGPMPTGATLSGTDVALTGSGWTDCTGTVAAGSITGTCTDGCGFEFIPY